jgi:hypothetical protein
MVDDDGVAVRRKMDVELEEQGDNRRWRRRVGGEPEKDVAVLIKKL